MLGEHFELSYCERSDIMRVETVVIPEHVVTTTYYKFKELSDESKEKVRQWYLEGRDVETFIWSTEDFLKDLYPNSKLECAFSLNYCQGDHFYIYGKFYIPDFYDKIKQDSTLNIFTDKEHKFISWMLKECYPYSEIPYSYKNFISYDNLLDDIIHDLENGSYKNVKWNVVEKFKNSLLKLIEKDNRMFMEDGYEYFYEISDEELEESCEANGYEFYEDGEIA